MRERERERERENKVKEKKRKAGLFYRIFTASRVSKVYAKHALDLLNPFSSYHTQSLYPVFARRPGNRGR